MADGLIQLPYTGTTSGKILDTTELTVGANTVQRERMIIGGEAATAIAVVTSSGGLIVTLSTVAPTYNLPMVSASSGLVQISGSPTIVSASSGLVQISGSPTIVSASSGLVQISGSPTIVSASSGLVQISGTATIVSASSGLVQVFRMPSTAGTVSFVADTTTNTTLKSASTSGSGVSVHNDSSAVLYLKCGATATSSDWTVRLVQYSYWESPYAYVGRVDGIWPTDPGDGGAHVTIFD